MMRVSAGCRSFLNALYKANIVKVVLKGVSMPFVCSLDYFLCI